MRIHPILLFFPLLASLASGINPCIDGCKCDNDTTHVKITECEKPFVLTKTVTLFSKKTVTIAFRNVEISTIEKDGFKGLENLQTIVFDNCIIGSMDQDAFDLPDLSTVSFTKTTFKENPVLSSQYLEELIFEDCNLREMPSLDNLPAVSFLNLAKNRITEIKPSTSESLEELQFSDNLITKFPPDLFVKSEDFSTLNLDNNPLMPRELYFPSTLEYLSLQNCNLTFFDRSLTKNLTSLSTLHLSGNKLSILPIDAFELITDLQDLDLSNNKLEELDEEIFSENILLDKLVLDNNPLKSLPKIKGTVMKTFSCSNCDLRSVKGAFDDMESLETINLSHNKLKNIDGVFSKENPTKIILSHNQISKIHINTFGINSYVQNLDLSNNRLAPLDPVVLASLTSLQELNISNNGLSTMWANHNSDVDSLHVLDVSNNEIVELKKIDLTILRHLEAVDFTNNPLICTDDSKDIVDYLVNKSIHQFGETHEDMSGIPITEDLKDNWQNLFSWDCLDDFEGDDEDNYDDIDDYDTPSPSVVNTGGFNLAKASYILSITSVFILSALFVLMLAVAMTFAILKRNKNFNMHNGNLPRLKIPLWHTTPGLKKHSGSIYRPLSEEIYGSRISNHYDFKQTPQVHNTQP